MGEIMNRSVVVGATIAFSMLGFAFTYVPSENDVSNRVNHSYFYSGLWTKGTWMATGGTSTELAGCVFNNPSNLKKYFYDPEDQQMKDFALHVGVNETYYPLGFRNPATGADLYSADSRWEFQNLITQNILGF